MSYKFRLVFYHSRPRFFSIDENSIDYSLSEKLVVHVVPRDTDTSISATKYHIEGSGFSSFQDAQNCGEKLRTHLRMFPPVKLNATVAYMPLTV